MRTGRPRQPAELQRAKGDPRKRGQRVLEAEAEANARAAAADALGSPGGSPELLAPAVFETPDYLTADRERAIFERVVKELLPRNIIRQTDFGVVARYAAYMHRWIKAKETLGDNEGWYSTDSTQGAGGVKMMRRHPAAVDMLDYGAELIKLETMIGLTPMARQSLLRGLQGLPKGAGGLFDQPRREPTEETTAEAEAAAPPASPRGFLVPASTTRN